MRIKKGGVQAAEYSLWGADVHRSRTQIVSNEDKEMGGTAEAEQPMAKEK